MLCLQAFTRRTAELQRLAWIYPTSRMQHIVARAWQAKQEAALQAAQASEGVAVQVSCQHSPAAMRGRQAGSCVNDATCNSFALLLAERLAACMWAESLDIKEVAGSSFATEVCGLQG